MNPHLVSRPTLANWRAAPFNRWAFHHVRELIPNGNAPSFAVELGEFPEARIISQGCPTGLDAQKGGGKKARDRK